MAIWNWHCLLQFETKGRHVPPAHNHWLHTYSTHYKHWTNITVQPCIRFESTVNLAHIYLHLHHVLRWLLNIHFSNALDVIQAQIRHHVFHILKTINKHTVKKQVNNWTSVNKFNIWLCYKQRMQTHRIFQTLVYRFENHQPGYTEGPGSYTQVY